MPGTVGFIGVGAMGGPMAQNLVKHGFSLVVHDIDRAKAELWRTRGATVVGSAAEVAGRVERTISMVETTAQAEAVIAGEHGIVRTARPGHIVASMSTIDPIAARRLGAELAAKGVAMLDAPVSGGEKGAIDGALSIMVGGDKAVFEKVLPIFQAMGKTITLLGPLGFGGFTKLANQIIVAVNLTALAEALTLGKKAGLDRELLLTALAGGLAGSKCLDQKRPNYLANAYNPGFKIDLHFKDLGLIMEAARALNVPLPTTAVVQELFTALRVKGRGGLDHSGVITLLEDLANVRVGKA